ncbi:MAG: lipid-A-disaccharide synthase [Victivallales bacterium]|nr:lipid-A-disaccharide synthase [Victivallales bacterium]
MQYDYNVWIISGEASGDMYGARLARELQTEASVRGKTIHMAGMGGPEMQRTDMEIIVDSTELGVVGLVEVFKHIFTFLGIFFGLVRRARRERPDAVVLIDYPGFNLRFAQLMYWFKIPVIWYVTPQVWAWGKHRIPKLARYCSRMMVIFPFETETYAHTRLGEHTIFTGHPLVDIINEQRDPELVRDPNIFLLLPGSRNHEVELLLDSMLDTVCVLHRRHPELRFVLSTPRERICGKVTEKLVAYRHRHPELPEIKLTLGDTRRWQQQAGTGLAASGTVTVECAISGLPLVVCYRLNKITFWVARMLVKLFRGHFTMVNIIADKTVFEEFLQWQVGPELLVPAIEKILPGGTRREEVVEDMDRVRTMLQCGSDNAGANAARVCLDFLADRENPKAAGPKR